MKIILNTMKEYIIPNSIYKLDGICKLRRMRFDDIYEKTMWRMCRIKALGFEVIYVWEKDYKQYLYARQ